MTRRVTRTLRGVAAESTSLLHLAGKVDFLKMAGAPEGASLVSIQLRGDSLKLVWVEDKGDPT